MAKVKTIKEILFDMLFEDMPIMEMLVYYNRVCDKAKLPRFVFNVYKNIFEDINEDEYSTDEPLLCVEDGMTVSKTNLEFVSQYFPKALKYILKDFDIYEEDIDYVMFEQFISRVISKSGKLKKYDIDSVIEMVMDKDLNILMDGNITKEMLLENMLDNINHLEDGDY